MASNQTTIGRIAPSPSGRMHLGNAFSALLAWAHARSKGGSFILRLEDLDERCRRPEHHEGLLEDLSWLGLDWDGEPSLQTDRVQAYHYALEAIEKRAEVYPCFCSRADLHVASAPHASDGSVLYQGTCRALDDAEREQRMEDHRYALRLHVPDKVVSFDDEIQGPYEQDLTSECGDFVVQRSDGVYAYQLACVVDDIHSGVTDIVRGSDLLASTPRQLYLYELLDAPMPRYAHHPMLLAPDGRRLSKRDGDLEIASLRERGFAAADIVGYLAHLAGQSAEPTPLLASELLESFDIGTVPAADVIVDSESLIEHGFVQ